MKTKTIGLIAGSAFLAGVLGGCFPSGGGGGGYRVRTHRPSPPIYHGPRPSRRPYVPHRVVPRPSHRPPIRYRR